MRTVVYLTLCLFVFSTLITACGTAPAPTATVAAPANTRSSQGVTTQPSPTLLATITSAPTATIVSPTPVPPAATAAATSTPAPTETAVPAAPAPPVATAVTGPKYSAPTLIYPLSKDVVYQKNLATIQFKWNAPPGATGSECYKVDVRSNKVNDPIVFYSDYFVVCGASQFTLSERGGADVELWRPFVPAPAETMTIHWTVTVVQAGAVLDKSVHRVNTPTSPASAEANFDLQTLVP